MSPTSQPKDLFQRPARTGPKHKNQIEYERKMSELDGKISYIKARMDELKGVSHAAGAEGSVRGGLIGELKKLREEARPLQDERRNWSKEAAELREVLKKKGAEMKEAKDKLPFKSVSEIEAQVKDYEAQLESGNYRLSEEKQIVQEISKLNRAKKTLLALESAPTKGAMDVGTMKAKVEVLHEKIRVRDGELQGLHTKIDALSAKLDELNGVKEGNRISREERQAQFEKLRAELDEAYEARRKAYEANRAQKEAAHEAYIKRLARQEEEKRRAVIEEEIADLEERLAAHRPESLLDKKLAACISLTAFFRALTTDNKKVENGAVEGKESAGRAVDASILEGCEVVKKADDDVFFMGGGKTGKKGGKKTASTSNNLGKLPIHVLAGLSDLNLTIPATLEQVPILLSALETVKTAIEGRQAEMEAAGEAELVDPAMQSILDKIAALKLRLDTPEPVAA